MRSSADLGRKTHAHRYECNGEEEMNVLRFLRHPSQENRRVPFDGNPDLLPVAMPPLGPKPVRLRPRKCFPLRPGKPPETRAEYIPPRVAAVELAGARTLIMVPMAGQHARDESLGAAPWKSRLDVGEFDVCCNSATVLNVFPQKDHFYFF